MAGSIDETTIERLIASTQGEVLDAAHPDYEDRRRVFNAMIDKRPSLILRCLEAQDIVRGVEFARDNGLPISVRGGGHSVAGNAVCDGGIMLDLSGMKAISVDESQRVAVAAPGLTLGEFDAATQAYGLATPLGVVSVTGIAGLTLGGGIGWLNGKYGLSCDNLLAADVVTADGRLLRASADENADLLWGLRGGGGNFGVVTSFTYRLHPVGQVLAGSVTFAPGRAASAMRFFHSFASNSPDELTMSAGLGRAADGRPVFSVTVCYCGVPEEGERVLQPLRSFGPPLGDTVQLMDYCALQSGGDAGFPEGRLHYWKASFLKDLSDDAIATILRFVAEMPSEFSAVGLQQMGGFASRVDPAATAFPHRARQYDFLILSQWDDSAETPRNMAWTREFFEAMRPFLEEGVYSNNLGEDGVDRAGAAYGANYPRLSELKAKYDPQNLFRLNINVLS